MEAPDAAWVDSCLRRGTGSLPAWVPVTVKEGTVRVFRRAVAALACIAALLSLVDLPGAAARTDRHFLYVASPGIRNYVEYGGVGILVYDMDHGHKFVRRIPTFHVPAGEQAENIKGIAANARTGRIYISTPKRVASFDLATDELVWNRVYEGGADRLSLSPDGKILYVPSFEGPHWHAVDALTGDVLAKVVTNSGAHNTIYGLDGRRVYLAGLRSPVLAIADPKTHTVVGGVGPFSDAIRPFTVNAKQTLCFVNVNGLLGFEVGDIKSGRMLHRVEVTGYQKGPVKRHGCPSHGVGLTPDEREVWVADGANSMVHAFDATVMPPKQIASIAVRDQPGWITFSLDGRYAYPSTGEVVDVQSKKIIAALTDEESRIVQSEKVVEIVFDGTKARTNGDQFGIGRRH
jgi:DNA-binding beta-propeller fold protein YncE